MGPNAVQRRRGQDVLRAEPEESLLFGAHLMDRDVVVSGIEVALQQVEMCLRIRTTVHALRNVAFGHWLDGGLVVRGQRKILAELTV